MIKGIKSIEKQKVKGKTILLRVDINSSVSNGKLLKSPKLAAHSRTIRKLAGKGAKVIVLSHQGRKGRADFIDLKAHKKVIQNLTDLDVKFFKWNQDYIKAINKMKEGEVILLDNTRFLDFETVQKPAQEHSQEKTIKELAEHSDYFVLDALSIAHRAHATVIGFPAVLESFAGPVLVSELEALEKVQKIKDNGLLILGGLKPEDSLKVMERMLKEKKVKKVLLGGALGELAIIAKGSKLGEKEKFLKEKGLMDSIPELKKLLEKYKDQIRFPVDLAVRRRGQREEISLAELPVDDTIYDVGEITVQNYECCIDKSDLVVFNGPLGKSESYQFAYGTRKILEAVYRSRAYSIVGGGDTVTSVVRLGFKEKEFDHVSLAGKALLQALIGEKLAGIEAIKE